jgi:hypothetical protein
VPALQEVSPSKFCIHILLSLSMQTEAGVKLKSCHHQQHQHSQVTASDLLKIWENAICVRCMLTHTVSLWTSLEFTDAMHTHTSSEVSDCVQFQSETFSANERFEDLAVLRSRI